MRGEFNLNLKVCSRCGACRSASDMGSVTAWDLRKTRYYCHPAWAVGTTCYMVAQQTNATVKP